MRSPQFAWVLCPVSHPTHFTYLPPIQSQATAVLGLSRERACTDDSSNQPGIGWNSCKSSSSCVHRQGDAYVNPKPESRSLTKPCLTLHPKPCSPTMPSTLNPKFFFCACAGGRVHRRRGQYHRCQDRRNRGASAGRRSRGHRAAAGPAAQGGPDPDAQPGHARPAQQVRPRRLSDS